MRLTFLLALLTLTFSNAYGADASERRFISNGMSEGEVLMKIGKPDNEIVETGGGAVVTVKQWMYFPVPEDPDTLTTITLKKGKVVNTTRDISR